VAGNAKGGTPLINLVGMAVGDPCTDNDSQRQSMDMLWYAHKNSLVPDREYTFLTNECGASHPSSRAAGAWTAEIPAEIEIAAEIAASTAAAPGTEAMANAAGRAVRVVAAVHRRARLSTSATGTPASPNCTAALRRYLISSSKGVSQSWERAFINELSLFSPRAEFRFDLPGNFNYNTAQWMMRADVRKALHVEASPAKAWPGPAPGWTYTSSYAACNDAAPAGTQSMVDFYRRLAPALPGKIVVYNGDTDPCVSYEGTRVAIEKVGFSIVQPYRPWFFNFTAAAPAVLQQKDLLFGPSLSLQSGGAQYGGEIVDYAHGLSFATVHGSGHMVPT
jgi:serine carboxypeptidase-like clade I